MKLSMTHESGTETQKVFFFCLCFSLLHVWCGQASLTGFLIPSRGCWSECKPGSTVEDPPALCTSWYSISPSRCSLPELLNLHNRVEWSSHSEDLWDDWDQPVAGRNLGFQSVAYRNPYESVLFVTSCYWRCYSKELKKTIQIMTDTNDD